MVSYSIAINGIKATQKQVEAKAMKTALLILRRL
jgi:hypothetical protein